MPTNRPDVGAAGSVPLTPVTPIHPAPSQPSTNRRLSGSSPYFGADSAPPLLRSNTAPDLCPPLLHRQAGADIDLDAVSAFSLPHSSAIRAGSPPAVDTDDAWSAADDLELRGSVDSAVGAGTQTPDEAEAESGAGTTLLTVEVDGNTYSGRLPNSGVGSELGQRS